MFTFTLPVFKHLVRRSSRFPCKTVFAKNCRNDTVAESYENECNLPDNLQRLDIRCAAQCIGEMKNHSDKEWKDLIKKLNSLNITNVSTKILQACLRLDKVDIGLSYYNYMLKEGQQLSDLELMFFSKLLVKRKSEIPKYEKLIINLYNNVKEHMLKSTVIKSFILELFVEVPTCFLDIVNGKKNKIHEMRTGNLQIVEKALELNMIEEAFDFMYDVDFVANESLLDSYIKFCIRRAEAGDFSVNYINRLVNLCAERATTWNHGNLSNLLNSLVNALMKHQNEYLWSVSKCELSNKQTCLNCGLGLKPVPISDAEFEKLKEYFFKTAIVGKNIFLRSSNEEVEIFLKFLKQCHPYDVVLDGLNLLYRTKYFGEQLNSRCLKYFLSKDFRVLTIGKAHSKRILCKPSFLYTKKNQKKAQFFFSSDMSDDDLFVLYATLYRGLKTCLITGDCLGTYSTLLNDEIRCLFLKWQLSHQYWIAPDGNLWPPLPHCGLPQLTKAPTNTDDRYVWHISRQTNPRAKIVVGNNLHWYCLQAVKKKKK